MDSTLTMSREENELSPFLSPNVFNTAIKLGDLPLIEFLYDKGCPWDFWTGINIFSSPEPLLLLCWLIEKNYPFLTEVAYKAAERGDLRILKYLKLLDLPLGNEIYFHASRSNNSKVIEWVRKNCLKF